MTDELKFPTFSFTGFESDVPVNEWEAARQVLGITFRDGDVKWIRETWAAQAWYSGIGLNGKELHLLADKLNALDTNYNFKQVYTNCHADDFYRQIRVGVAVDYNIRTFVVCGCRVDADNSGPMLFVGDKAGDVAKKVDEKCGGDYYKVGEHLVSWYAWHGQNYWGKDIYSIVWYYVDLVKMKVYAGNPANDNIGTFDIDRW